MKFQWERKGNHEPIEIDSDAIIPETSSHTPWGLVV